MGANENLREPDTFTDSVDVTLFEVVLRTAVGVRCTIIIH